MINLIILSNPEPGGFLANAIKRLATPGNGFDTCFLTSNCEHSFRAIIETHLYDKTGTNKQYFLIDCRGYLPHSKVDFITANLAYTMESLRAMDSDGIFIQPLSSHIYHEKTEYALSKRLQQDICKFYGEHGKRVVGLMIPPLYGIERRRGFVAELIGKFIWVSKYHYRNASAILDYMPCMTPIESHPDTMMSLVWVEDAARLILELIKKYRGLFNGLDNNFYVEWDISAPPIYIKDLIDNIAKHFYQSSSVEYTKDAPERRILNTMNTERLLDDCWHFQPFDEYLKKYYPWD